MKHLNYIFSLGLLILLMTATASAQVPPKNNCRELVLEKNEHIEELVYATEKSMFFNYKTLKSAVMPIKWQSCGLIEVDYNFNIKNRIELAVKKIDDSEYLAVYYDKKTNRFLYLSQDVKSKSESQIFAQWVSINPLKAVGTKKQITTVVSKGVNAIHTIKLILNSDSSHFGLFTEYEQSTAQNKTEFSYAVFDFEFNKIHESFQSLNIPHMDVSSPIQPVLLKDLTLLVLLGHEQGVIVQHYDKGKMIHEDKASESKLHAGTMKVIHDVQNNKLIVGFTKVLKRSYISGYGLLKYNIGSAKIESIKENEFTKDFCLNYNANLTSNSGSSKNGIHIDSYITDLIPFQSNKFIAVIEQKAYNPNEINLDKGIYSPHGILNFDCIIALMDNDGGEIALKSFPEAMKMDRMKYFRFHAITANKIVYDDKIVFVHFENEKETAKYYPTLPKPQKPSKDNFNLLFTTFEATGNISTKIVKNLPESEIFYDGNAITPLPNNKYLLKFYDNKVVEGAQKIDYITK